jgi:hypothetical protein
VPSTSIRNTKYDPDREVLSVWFFASGQRYDYEAVPIVSKRLRKGRFFDEHIRDRFKYRRASENDDSG